MIQKLITLFSIVLLSISAQAQFKIGIQAGISIANPSINTFPDAKSVTFVTPGIVSEYTFGKSIGIKPSMNYVRTGYNLLNTISSTTTIETIINTNNIVVPIDVFIPLKTKRGKLFFNAGPSVNISIGGTTELITRVNGVTSNGSINKLLFGDSSNTFKNINWGSNFGLGYQMNNGLELKANYNLGLTNTFNSTNVTIKNNILSVVAAYYFIK